MSCFTQVAWTVVCSRTVLGADDRMRAAVLLHHLVDKTPNHNIKQWKCYVAMVGTAIVVVRFSPNTGQSRECTVIKFFLGADMSKGLKS